MKEMTRYRYQKRIKELEEEVRAPMKLTNEVQREIWMERGHQMSRLCFTCKRLKASPEGKPGFSIGLRLGYWPCLKAPYIQLSFLLWQLSLWFGLESYRNQK